MKMSPCKDCPERSRACSDNCPKDARGEYGYKAWKADWQKQQALIKEYKKIRREDFSRSEECESFRQCLKNRHKRGFK